MQKITDFNQNAEENTIIVNTEKSFMKNSQIIFNGKGNILFIEDGVNIDNSIIKFNSDFGICYLSENKHSYYFDLTVYKNCCIFFGKNCYMNGKLFAVTSERHNIIVGSDCLFSYSISIRNADPHLVFDCESKKRINPTKSVYIGDHVWVGQSVIILKGAKVGSGSIIGAGCVLAGKSVPSNCAVAGNPAKIIKSGVFYTSKCVHNWDEEMTQKNNIMDSDMYIYSQSKQTLDTERLDKRLLESGSAEEKLDILQNLASNNAKNRFFIPDTDKKKRRFFSK